MEGLEYPKGLKPVNCKYHNIKPVINRSGCGRWSVKCEKCIEDLIGNMTSPNQPKNYDSRQVVREWNQIQLGCPVPFEINKI